MRDENGTNSAPLSPKNVGQSQSLNRQLFKLTPIRTTLFLDGGLYLGLYELGLGVCVGADQQHERVRPADLRGAFRFDVVRVVRVDRFFELEIREVEVDMLVRLPRTHHVIALNIGAAEANKRASQIHLSRNSSTPVCGQSAPCARWPADVSVPRRDSRLLS
jgi:hypothetical protein